MRAIELFAGAGGLALGLHGAMPAKLDLYEWNKPSCDNLSYNVKNGFIGSGNWTVFNADVRSVDYSRYQDKVDLLSGGPPCQPFSLGGKHKANHDARDMFPEAIRAVREVRPPVFVFENVGGLLRKSFATYFNYVLLQLQHPEVVRKDSQSWEGHLAALEQHHTSGRDTGLSYRVVFRLCNAADFGVPQLRHRVVIVGFRDDCGEPWSFPAPTHSREALLYAKWISKEYWAVHGLRVPRETPLSLSQLNGVASACELGCCARRRWRTVRDAIGDLSAPGGYANHEPHAGAKAYAGHSGSSLDEPSKAIKAGVHGVPGGENMVAMDDGTVRYYTVRESARLQTFPDSYRFTTSWSESMRQIGNAVPVRLASVIGSSIARHMERQAG